MNGIQINVLRDERRLDLNQWQREQLEHNQRAAEIAKDRLRRGQTPRAHTFGITIPPARDLWRDDIAYMMRSQMYLSPRAWSSMQTIVG